MSLTVITADDIITLTKPIGSYAIRSTFIFERKDVNLNYNPNNAVTRDDMSRIDDAARRRSAPRRSPSDKDSSERAFNNILTLMVWPLFFLYLETVARLLMFGRISGRQFAYAVLFSFSAGLGCAFLTTLFNDKRINFAISVIVSCFFTLYFNVQLIYYKFFSSFFYWDLLSEAGNATAFWRETIKTVFANWYGVILLILPFVLYCIFGRKYIPAEPIDWGMRGMALAVSFFLFLGGVGFVSYHGGDYDDDFYYHSGFSATEAADRFGLLTTLRLDTKYFLFGTPEDTTPVVPNVTTVDPGNLFIRDDTTSPEVTATPGIDTDSSSGTSADTEAPKPVDTSPNVLDIDFDTLIANATTSAERDAHTYFKNRTPTNKNIYTGMFEGKNLILITVEAWSPAAIDEKLTPTLWKMKNEGFVFENYYCSNWGGSTATGEYAVLSGNFYTSAKCLAYSADTLMKFAPGNMFKAAGYLTYGFHNHTYDYYSRNLSHPNMGYSWFGIGNWTKSSLFTSQWPKSDRELAVNTLDYITTDQPFHLYYMTVSGHAFQTFGGNANSKNHRTEVLSAGLNYTDQNALSYIAAEYEVELMVKTLTEELDRLGILEDTVFVMAPDHYPYNISDDSAETYAALSDLYKIPLTSTASDIEGNFDLYRAPLIIWSASMSEPVKVSKVCSAIDIMPTVYNLFGLDYDSRLITGRDILSDSEGFVPLNCNGSGGSWHWITDYGSYNTKTKTFTTAPGVSVSGDQLSAYISSNNQTCNLLQKYSKYILNEDYYRKVFPNG